MTKEHWLRRALPPIQRKVFRPAGLEVPDDVRLTCNTLVVRVPENCIGQCESRELAPRGVNLVFISPRIVRGDVALWILVHELVHAIDDCQHGHGAPFARMARAIGLEGKPSQTMPGPALRLTIEGIVARLGPYPNATEVVTRATPRRRTSASAALSTR